MGAWSASIWGNDTAEDLKMEYQAAFCCNDPDTALKKIDAYVRTMFDESDPEEWCCYRYSLADFLWKHGILTEDIRERTLQMIDSGFGLEIWEESGQAMLRQRKKTLSKLREKLMTQQPKPGKIRMKLHRNPVFETGDLVAIQLHTAGARYISQGYDFTEEEFREADGKFVVLRKVADKMGFCSAVEPSLREYWAVFQMYKKLFPECPAPEQLEGVPLVQTREEKNTFTSESSMVYYRRRNCRVIGKDRTDVPEVVQGPGKRSFLFFGVNTQWSNPESEILQAVLKGSVLK